MAKPRPVIAREPATCTAMPASATAQRPLCRCSNISAEKVENVVSAPRNPVTRNSRHSGASAGSQASYLDTLKAQWNQATQEERRQFLQWISQ